MRTNIVCLITALTNYRIGTHWHASAPILTTSTRQQGQG